MTEKEKMVLSDKSVVPTDEYIFSFIGEKKVHWKRIMDYLSENYKVASGNWNYYNDGKQWLFKMVHKKKTIFWASILTGTFRVTFYLGNKADNIIEGSDLPQNIKEEFRTAKRYGLIKPLTFIINADSDLDNVLKMIDLKTKIK